MCMNFRRARGKRPPITMCPYPTFATCPPRWNQPPIEAQSEIVSNQSPPHAGDPLHGLLDGLNLDSETLLIIGLLFLLYNEHADNVLLLALAYLLL